MAEVMFVLWASAPPKQEGRTFVSNLFPPLVPLHGCWLCRLCLGFGAVKRNFGGDMGRVKEGDLVVE